MKRKRRQRLIALVLVLLLFLGWTGCSEQGVETETFAENETGLPTITMHLSTDNINNAMEDFPLVEEQIRQIVREKLQIHLDIILNTPSDPSTQLNTLLVKGQQVDIFYAGGKKYYENGQLLDITELLEAYGQGIIDAVGREYLEFGKINGRQYGLLNNRDYASASGISFRKDLLEKYQIDIRQITNFDDLTEIFRVIKANEPDMFCVAPMFITHGDNLGGSYGILQDGSQELKVVNFYETADFEEQVRRFRQWYLDGYLSDSAFMGNAARRTLVKDGKLFSYIGMLKPGMDVQESNLCTRETVSVQLSDTWLHSSIYNSGQWRINSSCEDPVAAMKLLNLLYTDEELMNLLCWGIEGKHYVVLEDGSIDYPEGVYPNTTGYSFNLNWKLPNQFIAHIWKGDSPTVWEDMKTFNNTAKKSPAFGFTFDNTSTWVEQEAVDAVCDVYLEGFRAGMLDPDTVLPGFIQAMKEAGVDRIIEEKQRQLDDWLAKGQG